MIGCPKRRLAAGDINKARRRGERKGEFRLRILVTGGCGFIGARLVSRLEARGADVTILDDESLGSPADLSGFKGRYFKGDVADRGAVRRALEGADTVVHLAAHTRVVESVENPEIGIRSNVLGTFNVLEESRLAGVKRLVNASTGGAILGDAPAPIHEGMVAAPLAPYGASKLAGEGYCSAYSAAYGLPCASLRFSNIYGPGSLHKGSVVAHFIKSILRDEELVVYGNGEQRRDFLFIDDLIPGILSALESDVSGVFQLGSGAGVSVNELIETLRHAFGPEQFVRVRYEAPRPGEVSRTWCDISKARAQLGFEPRTAFSEGIQRTIAWFLERRDRVLDT